MRRSSIPDTLGGEAVMSWLALAIVVLVIAQYGGRVGGDLVRYSLWAVLLYLALVNATKLGPPLGALARGLGGTR